MTRKRRQKPEPEGVGAGERWETRGGAGVYLVRGPRIGGFSEVGRGTARERAQLAAQAPLMYEALLGFVTGMRETYGALTKKDGAPYQGHEIGCSCRVCGGVRALALAEGGGRCIVCGCTEFDACIDEHGSGCAWADREQFVCNAHPPKVVEAAVSYVGRFRV